VVLEKLLELSPFSLARDPPIRAEDKAGYARQIEILAKQLMEECLLLVQRGAVPEHFERLITETSDKLGWICVSRSGQRSRQRRKNYKSARGEKIAQHTTRILPADAGRPAIGSTRQRCLHEVIPALRLYRQIDWDGDS
jgi:hypothetical protein